jgi:hypothetical protein
MPKTQNASPSSLASPYPSLARRSEAADMTFLSVVRVPQVARR